MHALALSVYLSCQCQLDSLVMGFNKWSLLANKVDLLEQLNGSLHRMLGGSLGGAVFVCSAGTVQSCLQKGLAGHDAGHLHPHRAARLCRHAGETRTPSK